MRGTTKLIIAIIILIILGAGGYALFHKSSNNGSSGGLYGSSSPPASTNNTSAGTNKTPATANIIQTKTDASAGQYLADGSGKTLYTYGGDTSGVSNCTGSCLSNWPAYIQTSTSASLPANVTVIKRSDNGAMQYAYKGLPLYYFTGDSSAGQVTGNNVENFQVAKP